MALKFTASTPSGASNGYIYVDLSSVTNYTIQAGDVLEYELYLPEAARGLAFDYTTSSGTPAALRESTAADQNGLLAHPGTDLGLLPVGQWYHRSIPLPAAHVGEIITQYDLVSEVDDGAGVVAYFRNIRITDGAGTVRKNIWSEGDALPSSVVHIESPSSSSYTLALGNPPITRTATGLLAAYEAGSATRPFSTADWETRSGLSLSLSSGRLRAASSISGWTHARLAAVADRSKVMLHAVSRSPSSSGMWGGFAVYAQDAASRDHARMQWSVGRSAGEINGWSQNDDSSEYTILGSLSVPDRSIGVDYRFAVAVEDGWMVGHDFQVGETFPATEPITFYESGGVGVCLGSANVREHSAFFAMVDRVITASGMPDGWALRAGGLTSDAAVGGTATLDLFTAAFPIVGLEVLDELGVAQAAFSGEVWGGDDFSYGASVDEPPTASITAPNDGKFYIEGETITLTGSGTDAEDGSLTAASLSWSSDLDGVLGTGASLDVNSLSVGTHMITLTATDTAGGTGTDTITLEIGAFTGAEILMAHTAFMGEEWQQALRTAGHRCTLVDVDGNQNMDLSPYDLILHANNTAAGNRTFAARLRDEWLSVGKPVIYYTIDDDNYASGTPLHDLGLTTYVWGARYPDEIEIVDNGHPITEGYAIGRLLVGSNYQSGIEPTAGGVTLATFDPDWTNDVGSTLLVYPEGTEATTDWTLFAKLGYFGISPRFGVWNADAQELARRLVAYVLTHAPDQPTITVTPSVRSALLEGSAFVDADPLNTHAASQWQVDAAGGDFSAPIEDSGADALNLTQYPIAGLEPRADYLARVRHQDQSGQWSMWSATVAFTTDAVWESCGVPPATGWDACAVAPTGGSADTLLERTLALGPYVLHRFRETDSSQAATDESGNARDGYYGAGGIEAMGVPGLHAGDTAIKVRQLPDVNAVEMSADLHLLVRNFTVIFVARPAVDTTMPAAARPDGAEMTQATDRWLLYPDHGSTIPGTGSAGMGVAFGTNGIVIAEHAHIYAPPRTLLELPFDPEEYVMVALTATDNPTAGKSSIFELSVNGVHASELGGRYEVDLEGGNHVSAHSILIGGNGSMYGEAFGGYLDSWIAFDRVLTAEEIAELYAAARTSWEACSPRPSTPWSSC